MLQHRSGQNGEDLYLYNRESKTWVKSTSGREAGTPEYTPDIINAIKKAKAGQLVSFHNHPASMPPSAADLNAARKAPKNRRKLIDVFADAGYNKRAGGESLAVFPCRGEVD